MRRRCPPHPQPTFTRGGVDCVCITHQPAIGHRSSQQLARAPFRVQCFMHVRAPLRCPPPPPAAGMSPMSIFKEPELMDDLDDHWSAKKHQDERRFLIENLQVGLGASSLGFGASSSGFGAFSSRTCRWGLAVLDPSRLGTRRRTSTCQPTYPCACGAIGLAWQLHESYVLASGVYLSVGCLLYLYVRLRPTSQPPPSRGLSGPLAAEAVAVTVAARASQEASTYYWLHPAGGLLLRVLRSRVPARRRSAA